VHRRRFGCAAGAALLTAGLVAFIADRQEIQVTAGTIGGPYARMLAAAAQLGPARSDRVKLTAALGQPAEPVRLDAWSAARGLSVRWQPGEDWAVIEGAPATVAAAFGVEVNDYRISSGPDAGRVFYASPQQPAVPGEVGAEVTGLGRILGYLPHRMKAPPTPPLDVPDGGLLPPQLLTAYNAAGLVEAGHTGRDVTVVVFAFDGYDQEDMDLFSDLFDLPRFAPEVVGGMPTQRSGEATMDLQVVHAVAPDAKLVLVNARSTFEDGGGLEQIGQMLRDTDRRFPGAIWSLSIGWGCERLFTAADLAPVRSATAAALRNGTTAFIATGDLAGLECKGGQNWSDPPSPDDVGVDAVAALPEMTAVGGTRLSTDADGRWLAEQSWYDVPLTQGSAGGASQLFDRPRWQTVGANLPAGRLIPDISAVGDPFTGVKHVFQREVRVGGGTSQSAPIWAGLAAIMNDKFASSGAAPLAELNPLLYQVARSSTLPSFRDVRYGGNAVTPSGIEGYDTVTGLGTPNVENLVKAILLARSGSR